MTRPAACRENFSYYGFVRIEVRAEDEYLCGRGGRVTEAASGEPLAGVNVFFSKTTLGTSSDADGRYELRHVPTGPFELVASMVPPGAYVLTVTVRDVTTGRQVSRPRPIELAGSGGRAQ